MAKGKRATALFEVMSKAKMPGKGLTPGCKSEETLPPAAEPAPSILSPKWWFKSRERTPSGVRTMAPGEAHAPAESPAAPIVMPARASESEVAPAAAPEPRGEPLEADRPQPLSFLVDRDRQQINLKLSYTSAMIGGLSLVVLVAIAVLIGKGLSRGPATAIANQSTPQLRSGPATPGVLNVARRADNAGTNDPGAATERRTGGSTGAAGHAASTGTRTTQAAFNDPHPPATFFTDDPKRINGLNYAIIQSYPDKEVAGKAAEFLTKHGIPCTVEQNLPGWRLPWPSGCVLVGTRGFPKVQNNPALESYKKSILDLGVQFAGGRSRFNAFDPTMYRWNKSN